MDDLLQKNWVKKTLKRLPNWVSIFAVILLGALLAKLIWLWFTPKPNVANFLADSSVSINSQVVESRANYGKQVAALHLFGKTEKKAVKKSNNKKEAPVTNLNLKLHGTVAYSDHSGFAMISASGKKQKNYSRGDPIAGGSIVVTAIYSDYVLLKRNGKQEKLLMPKTKTTATNSRLAPAVLAPSIPPPAAPLGGALAQPNVPLDTNNLENLRQEIISNPSKLMDIAQASPVTEGDKFLGFRLTSGKNKKLFDAMGFKSGDIVQEVNGIVIESPAQGLSIMQILTTADSIVVTVKRGEEVITLDGVF